MYTFIYIYIHSYCYDFNISHNFQSVENVYLTIEVPIPNALQDSQPESKAEILEVGL